MTGRETDMAVRDIEITTLQLEEIIVRTHGLADDAAPTISSRLRYLQRMGFPGEATTGRGKRLAYGLADALRILIVFRYLEWSLSPVRAMRTVTMNWPHLSRALAIAWRVARTDGAMGDNAADRRLLVVAPSALGDAGGDPTRSEEQAPETVTPMTTAAIAEWGSADGEDGDACQLLVLDPVRFVRRLARAIEVACKAYPFEVDAAFEAMGKDTFGADDPAGWRFG